MSVESEIIRLQTAKADLKTSIEDKGVTVPSSTKLDGYANLVDSISGGGGSIEDLITKGNLVRIIINIYDTDFTLDASNNFSDTNGTMVTMMSVNYIKLYFNDLEIDTRKIGPQTVVPNNNYTYNFLVVGSKIFGIKKVNLDLYIYLDNAQIGYVHCTD